MEDVNCHVCDSPVGLLYAGLNAERCQARVALVQRCCVWDQCGDRAEEEVQYQGAVLWLLLRGHNGGEFAMEGRLFVSFLLAWRL